MTRRRRVVWALASAAAVGAMLLISRACGGDAADVPAAPSAGAAARARTADVVRPPRSRAGTDADAVARAASDALDVATAKATPRRGVLVVDEAGRAVVGALLEFADERFRTVELSDAEGRAAAPAGSTVCRTYDGTGRVEVPVVGGVARVVLHALPSLEVDVVDGLTGARIDAASVTARHRLGNFPEDVEVAAEQGRAVFPAVAFRRAGTVNVELDAAPPAGWIAEGAVSVEASPGPGVRRIRATIRAYREAAMVVRATYPDGRPASGVSVVSVDYLRGRADAFPWTSEPGGDPGTVRVRGIPDQPHAQVRLQIVAEDPPPRPDAPDGEIPDPEFGTPTGTTAWLRPGIDTVADVQLEFVVDGPFEGPGSSGTIGIGGGNHPTHDATEFVAVRVVAIDGSPVPRARVCAVAGPGWSYDVETDADGRARLRLAPGRITLVAVREGMLPAVASVDLPGAGEVVLREPAGRPFTVTIVDAAGRPCPFARGAVCVESVVAADGASVRMPRNTWLACIDGDVQHAPVLADASGRIVFPRAPDGRVRVTATLGGATGEATTTETEARVVVRTAEIR